MKSRRIYRTLVLVFLVLTLACRNSVLNKTAQNTASSATAAAAWTSTPQPTSTNIPTPAANDLLMQNSEAMKSLEENLMTLIMTIETGGQTLELRMDGAIEYPQKSFFKVSSSEQTAEVVTLDGEEVFTRENGSGVWVGSSTEDILSNYGSYLTPEDLSKSAVIAGEETLDGIDSYIVDFEVDVGKFISQDPSLSAMCDALASSGSGRIWIGKQDFLTRKLNLNLAMVCSGEEFTYNFEETASAFNEPVQIPDPDPHYHQILLQASDPVFEVAFSPDSSILAACDDDQMIYLWSTADFGTDPKIIEHPDLKQKDIIQTADFYSLSFSPDGKTLAAGTQGQVLLYSPLDPMVEPQVLIPSGGSKYTGNDFNTVSYSPDGKFLAAGGGGSKIYIWSTGQLNTAPRILKGHTTPVVDLSFTPDGKTLISASEDGTILLWSVEKHFAPLSTLAEHKEDFHDLSISPDGQYLLSVGFHDPVYMWSINSPGNHPESLIPREDESIGKFATLAIAISPDGKTLATADAFGVVRLWSLENPAKPFAILSTKSQYDLMTITFSPDGKYLSAGSGDATVYVWVLEDQQ